MVFRTLLCGECYENFKVDGLYAFKRKHFRNTRHAVTFGIPL
jgi:hypothetical protein